MVRQASGSGVESGDKTAFVTTFKARLAKEHPTWSTSDIERVVQEMWRFLSKTDQEATAEDSGNKRPRAPKTDHASAAASSAPAAAPKSKAAPLEKSSQESPNSSQSDRVKPHRKKRAKLEVIIDAVSGEKIKRSSNPFMMFRHERFPQLKDSHPEMRVTDITKLLGEEWRGLSEDRRKVYQKLADDDKTRYLNELEANQSK